MLILTQILVTRYGIRPTKCGLIPPPLVAMALTAILSFLVGQLASTTIATVQVRIIVPVDILLIQALTLSLHSLHDFGMDQHIRR